MYNNCCYARIGMLMAAIHDNIFSYEIFRTIFSPTLLDWNISYPDVDEYIYFVGKITYDWEIDRVWRGGKFW
jgi:hypothetical protein